MRQVLFQDALDLSGDDTFVSTATAAHLGMRKAMQAMSDQQSSEQLSKQQQSNDKAPALQAAQAARPRSQVSRSGARFGGGSNRFKGGNLPKPTRLCYGGARPRTAAAVQRGHAPTGVKGGSPSRLPTRRVAPPAPPTRANATSSCATGTALAKELHPNRSGRASMRHNVSTAQQSNTSLRRLAVAKYGRGWRRGGSVASSVAHTDTTASDGVPASPSSTGTERTGTSSASGKPTPEARPAKDAGSSATEDVEAAVAAMYASLSKAATLQARRNAAASGRSQLDEEAAQRRRAEAEQKAFRAATTGDDDAAAVFLGLKQAPGAGSSHKGGRNRREGGGSRAPAPFRQPPPEKPLAVDQAEAAAARELMELTSRMGQAMTAAEDVSRLASPAAARAAPAGAVATPAKQHQFGSPLQAAEAQRHSDVDSLMSPDPRYGGERWVELAAHEPMPALPPRDPSKPPTYLDTQLLPGGRGPRYLQSVKSRIAPLVKHFKQNKANTQNSSKGAPGGTRPTTPARKLPPSQAGALLYAVATGQDAVPTSQAEKYTARASGPKLGSPNAALGGGLPCVEGTASHPGLPGVTSGYIPHQAELDRSRTREAQAQEAAATAVAVQRAQVLAARGVRMSRAAVGWEVPTHSGVAPPEVPLPPSAASTLHLLRKAELRRAAAASGTGGPWPQAQLMTRNEGATPLGESVEAPTSPPRLPAWYTELVSGLQQVGMMLQAGEGGDDAAAEQAITMDSEESHTDGRRHMAVPHMSVALPAAAAQQAVQQESPAAQYSIQHDARGIVTGASALATARAFLRGPVHAALAGSQGPATQRLSRIPPATAPVAGHAGGVSAGSISEGGDGGNDADAQSAPEAGIPAAAAAAFGDASSSDGDWEAALEGHTSAAAAGRGDDAEELFDLAGLQQAVEAVRGIASRGNAAVNELDLSSGSSSSGFSGAGM